MAKGLYEPDEWSLFSGNTGGTVVNFLVNHPAEIVFSAVFCYIVKKQSRKGEIIMKKILVTDFTLKNASVGDRKLSFRDKTNIAKCLDSVGVDAIELSALKNTKEDAVINRTIAGLVKNCTVKISAGLTEESLNEAFDSIKDAVDPCIRITVPVSTVQMEYMYHVKAPKMLEMVADMCAKAKEKCEKVEFVAVDASRADREFLKEISAAAFNSGATAVTLCDDAGIMMPEEFAQMVADVKSASSIAVFVMPSDELNMAAANAVAAIKAGADGVETCSADNWLQAGVLSDIIRKKGIDLGVESSLDATVIHRNLDEMLNNVSDNFKVTVAPEVGEHNISLNSNSTLAEVSEAVRSLGYELSHADSGKVYEEFCRVANKKEKIGVKEIDAIVASAAMQVPSTYHVESYVINSGNIITATANIQLSRNGELLTGTSTGDGPINAAFLAIEQVIGHHYELDDFQIQSVTEGHEAMGSAIVKLRDGDKLYSGSGVSTDIIGASIRADVNALNKIVYGAK